MSDKKTGVYICSGCGLGEAFDVAALEKTVGDEFNAALCKSSGFLCEEAGVNEIKGDIRNEGLDAVMIAACSTRVNYDVFDFGEKILVERVDLREKVAWCQDEGSEDTLDMAKDYLRMGAAKLKEIELTVPFVQDVSDTILVIGGGVAGMTSALGAGAAGHNVLLVEKSDRLGGFMRGMKKTLPRNAPYINLEENSIEQLTEEVKADRKISVHLNSIIKSIVGAPGMFDVTIENGATSVVRAGAVVVATGFRPYEKEKLTDFGSDLPDVVTSVEFEGMAASGKIVRPSNGEPVGSALFVQCAGSRDKKHLPYCSSICCSVSLKQALYLREEYPDSSATIVYKDIRTPGKMELFYKQAQLDPGIFLVKGEIDNVTRDGDNLQVHVNDSLLGPAVSLKADLVVLATGMVSSTYDASVTIDKPEDQMTDDDRAKSGKASILNLQYRKGPELPHLKEEFAFPDSHFICFPYETQRTGIYAAGSARSPQGIADSIDDALGATVKAIQSVKLVGAGKAVSPRAGDTSYPDFFLQRCTQCKRCTVECPFGTLDEDKKGTPKPNPTRCRRCGICMGACPERIISFANYSINMISSMIKAIEAPDEFSGKLRVLMFVCENDAMPAIEMAGLNRLKYDAQVRIIPLRCLGSTNIVWIADALAAGFDGVIMLGCKHGDDYQCHFVKGSELAETRMSKVQETLDRLMLESERILVESISINEAHKVPEIIDGFMENLSDMEPNPYKGF